MFKTQNSGSNYLARIVKLGPPRKHSNADRLICFSVCFNNCITDTSYQEGDMVVYFPLESQINKEFISYINGFQKKELNNNQNVKGFFDNNARVRAIRLRQEQSGGFIIKLEVLFGWLGLQKIYSSWKETKALEKLENLDFDTFSGVLTCQKYTIPVKNPGAQNKEKKKVKRESKIIDGQFRVSEDTAQLKRNIEKINPDDIITISYKMHGTNSSIGRVLCKRKLNLFERVLKFCGVKLQESIYDLVYASRTIVKNAYADKINNSYYSEDVWKVESEKLTGKIQDGIILYGEICGQLPSGGWIQKGYDYSISPNNSEFYCYRITYTKPNGEIIEFTTPQIQRYCQKFGIKTVPIFFYGRAKDLAKKLANKILDDGVILKQLDEQHHWHETFLKLLIFTYNEKDCYMCKNKVPEEGIVLTKEGDFFEGFKLKSFKFLERETKELDSGETNIEDSESGGLNQESQVI